MSAFVHLKRQTNPDRQVFDLPEPPSTNDLYRNVSAEERARAAKFDKKLFGRKKTDRYRTWLNAAKWLVNGTTMQGQSLITIVANSERADIDNLTKAPIDLLKKRKILVDDSRQWIGGVNLRWSDHIEGIRVIVEPMAADDFDVGAYAQAAE